MINKDYILRIAERFGKELAILLHLRERSQFEEALIHMDDLYLNSLGLTIGFVNSISEEVLLTLISTLGAMDSEKCLWVALLLKTEGDIYDDQGKSDEAYYRYVKSLYFSIEVVLHTTNLDGLTILNEIEDMLNILEEYELPLKTKNQLFRYYERLGNYDKAEDALFDIAEMKNDNFNMLASGTTFYERLLSKSNADLAAGNFSREEAKEGLSELQRKYE
ncbi:MAG TPA: DUF6483 family protein [Ktedonobacteraceae bacterium]|nr:DUF6483 family protein [Ktedonobacteraceae bacterium]